MASSLWYEENGRNGKVNAMMGSIEVKILIRLNQDITPEVAMEFVNEMEYTIKDTTGKVSIAETEIIDSNVGEEV